MVERTGVRARRCAGRSRHAIRRALQPDDSVSHAPRIQQASRGDGDAPLHEQASVARPVARSLHDSARLLHDEAQRDRGDDADHVAGDSRKIHPFAPLDQTTGYQLLFDELETALAEITGFAAVSLQPNAGSQGEYAGLLVIDAYHASRGHANRKICLIPQSAHGTNPASAVMAGMKVVVVMPDERGNIDVADLRAKAEAHARRSRRTDGHLSFHARRVRGNDRRDLRNRPQLRRPGLHGRREHERNGRPVPAGGHRRRRLSPQSPQDFLHSARRRRAGHGTDRRREASGSIPPRSSGSEAAWASRGGRRLGGAVGQREHSADFARVHPADGRRGTRIRDQDRDPQRQLHRQAAGAAFPGAVQGRATGQSRTNALSTRAV